MVNINNEHYKSYMHRIEIQNHGYEIANEYCEYDPSTIYIIINRHIGDSVRVLQMLEAVKEYYGVNADRYHFRDRPHINPVPKTKTIKNIYVITTKSISGVAKLYSYAFDKLIILSKNDLNALEFYSCSPAAIHQNIICDENAYRTVFNRWKTDEGSWVRSLLSGCWDLRWHLCLPSKIKLSSMKISPETEEETNLTIKKYAIELDKIVVLCPYAQSSSNLDEKICEKLTSKLTMLGYKVFTNAFGDERIINGTTQLAIDVDQLACLVVRGCRVIAVQSGLADVLVRIGGDRVLVLNIIKTRSDLQFANSRNLINEVNHINNVTYLRIEHFEEDYVLKLLMDNFH